MEDIKHKDSLYGIARHLLHSMGNAVPRPNYFAEIITASQK